MWLFWSLDDNGQCAKARKVLEEQKLTSFHFQKRSIIAWEIDDLVVAILVNINVVVNEGNIVVQGRHVCEGGCKLKEHVCSEALSHRKCHHVHTCQEKAAVTVNVLPKLHIIRWETKASEVQNAEDLTAEESKTQNLTSESQMAESDKVSVDSKEAIDCKLLCERLTDLREAENVTETQVRGEIGKAWPDAQEAKAYTDTERRDSKSKARPA